MHRGMAVGVMIANETTERGDFFTFLVIDNMPNKLAIENTIKQIRYSNNTGRPDISS